MKLHFDAKGVRTLVEWSETHEPDTLYDTVTGPGLWLVGDDGVYLMSNARESLAKPDGKKGSLVVHARECDPKLDFDEWWENKRASFGGDDGAEFLGLAEVKDCLPETGDLVLDVTPTQIKFLKKVRS